MSNHTDKIREIVSETWSTEEKTDELDKLLESEIEKAENRLYNEIVCTECTGSGTYHSPSDYSPCSFCDGTGVYLDDRNLNEVLESLTKKGE